jgi:hypothetical protein
MEQASQLVQAAVAGMKKAFLALAAVTGVALSFREIAQGIGQAVRRGKELDMLARETGRTAEEIAMLTEATHRAELSMADAASIAQTLGNNWREAEVGATGFAGQLSMLGIEVGALQKMSMPEQFALIAERINQIKDPVVRAKLAFDLLGDAGRKAVANYQSGDLQKAAELLGKNAKDVAGAAALMARISDAWNRIKRSGEAFFDQIATKIAPYIEQVATFLEETLVPAAVKFGEKIGNAMKYVLDVIQGAFASGKVGQLVSLSLQTAFAMAIDYLISGLKFAFDVAGQLFKAIWDFTDLADGLLLVLGGAAAGFAAAVLKALSYVFTLVLTTLEYGVQAIVAPIVKLLNKLGMDIEYAKSSWSEIWQKNEKASPTGQLAGKVGKIAQEGIKEGAGALTQGIPAAAKEIQNILAKTKFENLNLLGSKERMDELGKLAKELATIGAAKTAEAEKKALKNAKRPGEGGVAIAKGMGGEASFDEFRRVGGGIGGKVAGIQQRMLDKLSEIAANTKAFGERRFTGGSQQSLEMGAVR